MLGTLGAGTIALLLLVVPFASAGAVASFAPPFTGATAVHFGSPTLQGGGATLTVSTPAAFTLSTGTATGAASAAAGPSSGTDSQATYDGKMGVRGLTFTPTAAGAVSVKAYWTVTWNASASMTKAAANAGSQSTIEIYLVTQLVDLTAKKTVKSPVLFIAQKDLASASSYKAGQNAAKFVSTISGVNLVAGHQYGVLAVVQFSVQVAVPQGSPATSHVTAVVDLGSKGHGAFLTSVVVA
jgi:hypothetical protein